MMTMLANPRRMADEVMAETIAPPPPVDYEQWAIDNIVFSKRESEFPGPYNPDLFPLNREILKALSPDDPCRIVTQMGSAQIGKTVLANIFAGGSMAMDPGDLLYTHPTEENARRWSRIKLQQMLRNTTTLQAIFTSRSRDAGDSVFYKERADGRGAILISGANSPASLSQVTMPRQVQDDLAKWETNAAGDPEKQADSRSISIEFAKIFKISTPLIKPGCRITKSYEKGSREKPYVPCPQCGHMHVLTWENLKESVDPDHPERAHFTCPANGCVIEDHHRPQMLRRVEWRAENPKAARFHRSFWQWAAYSLLVSLERIARAWIEAKGEPGAEQVFANDTAGEAYEAKGEAPPWEELKKRADAMGHRFLTIPAGGVLLTIGVDCQKDTVEWSAWAWGREMRRYLVDHGVIEGHISDVAAQSGLEGLLGKTWRNASGRDMRCDLLAIDGNAFTEDVWDWAKKHPISKVIMVRGVGSEQAPRLARVKRERDDRTGKIKKYARRFYNFGSAVLKMALYRNLEKTDPLARGFVGLPQGLDDDYFQQLTAERRIEEKRKDGFVDYKWVKHHKNEMLDSALQAEAAGIKLGVRAKSDAEWDRLEVEREAAPDAPQLDLEDAIVAGSKPAPTEEEPGATVADLAALNDIADA